MLVILEGVNRVGKTTLVHLLSKYEDVVVLNNKFISNLTNDDLKKDCAYAIDVAQLAVFDSMQQKDKIYLVDRFHSSEQVYGELLRGYNNHHQQRVEEYMSEKMKDTTIVVLYGFSYNVFRLNNLTKQYPAHFPNLIKVQEKFMECYANTKQAENIYCMQFCTDVEIRNNGEITEKFADHMYKRLKRLQKKSER